MKNNIKSSLIGIVTGFLNGLFGSGGGTVIVPALKRILDFEPHKAHATAISVILPLSAMSAFIYVSEEPLDWKMTGLISLGGVVGGFIGAKLLTKIKAKWLHKIFGAFMIVAAIRMIF